MAAQTPRYALNFFGGDTPGTVEDDNDKYTSEDRLTIDRVLAAFEKHTHRVTASMTAPDVEPTLTLGNDGVLDAGTTFYYVVSFVNGDGLETVAGPEVSIDMPDELPEPPAPDPDPETSTGTLDSGMYYYALTGIRDDEESALGEPVTCTVLDGQDTVTLTLPDLGAATSFQVWRMGDEDPGWTRIGTSSTTTFIDNGSVPAGAYGDPANIPPSTNTGVSAYSVTIALTDEDLTNVTAASAWRIYRTEESGAYPSTSLVHEVVEHQDEDDDTTPLLTSWIDDGDAQLTGSPKLFSTELQIPPYTFEQADTLPAATGYPDNYPIVDGDGVLSIARGGVWAAVSGQRGVAVFTGQGNPSGNEPTGAQNGDVYIDTNTGDIYLIDGL